jgi:hypothetical protein
MFCDLRLYLIGEDPGYAGALLAIITAVAQVRVLTLEHIHITDADILPIIITCPRLKRLTLGTPISQPLALTDATVLALAQQSPLLDTLDLRGTEMRRPLRITESALLTLVERCRKLRRVALPRNVVSAAATSQLEEDHRGGRRLHRVTQLGWM